MAWRPWRVVCGVSIVALLVAVSAIIVDVPSAQADAVVNQRMLELVNKERAANGLRPVVADARLGAAAEDAPYTGCPFPVAGRARDMVDRNYFSHAIKGCDVQNVFNLVNALVGVVLSANAENIAWMSGTTDPVVAAENLHSQLMTSPIHRGNILNANYTRVGIGSWHTSPGQTWSAAGFALTNVYIGVQIFAAGAVDPVAAPAPTGSKFHPLPPARAVDTRTGVGAPAGALGPGATVNVPMLGRAGVPETGVGAVVLNVTVTGPTAESWLTVYPTGEIQPAAANINYGPGQTVGNLVMAKLGPNGQISLFNAAGSAHVIADVAGWFDTGTAPAGARFHPLPPGRALDTRAGIGVPAGALGPGATITLPVLGSLGVPTTGVGAVVLNITVTGPTAASWLTVFPAGEVRPAAANINYAPGQTVGNLVVAKLGTGGQVSLWNAAGSVHVIADVAGWFDAGAGAVGSRFHPLPPNRALDTRAGVGAPAGALGPGATVNVPMLGRVGVPSTGVAAVVLNVTVTGPTAASWLTVFPAGEVRPAAANINFGPGQTVGNLVVAKLGANGQISLFNALGTAHVIADVAGWFDVG